MNILNVSQYTNLLLEMAARKRVVEEISDFFRMFETQSSTIAYVYYANGDPSKLSNKTCIIGGVKQPNPMYGRIFKLNSYRFLMNREYQDTLRKKYPEIEYDPNAPINQEKKTKDGKAIETPWVSLSDPGRPCVLNVKNNEVALPLVEPKTMWTKWVILNDHGDFVEVDKNDIRDYLKPLFFEPKKESTSPYAMDYKKLYVNKIFKLNAGGKSWTNNQDFLYPTLVDFFKK